MKSGDLVSSNKRVAKLNINNNVLNIRYLMKIFDTKKIRTGNTS